MRLSVADRNLRHLEFISGHRRYQKVARMTATDTPSVLRLSTMGERIWLNHLLPPPDANYLSARRDYCKMIVRTIDATVAPHHVVQV